MRIPVYRLQIVDLAGRVVELPAGGRLERDFIRDCTDAIVRRHVGIWRSETHVRAAIAEGIEEVIQALKRETS